MNSRNKSFRFSSLPSSTYIFVILLVLFSITVPNFFTPANFSTILEQAGVLVLISIGASFPIMTGGIDLAAGSVISLCGISMGVFLHNGIPDYIAVLGGVLVGTLFGFCNGYLVHKIKVPPFITTFGTMGIAESLANFFSDSRTIYWKENTNVHLIRALKTDLLEIWFGNGNSKLFSISGIVLFIFLVVAASIFIFNKTSWKENIYAIGHNIESARLCGIKVLKFSIGAYAISGCMSGIAAILILVRSNCATPIMGSGMEFQAIVAATIGGNVAEGGKGSIPGSIIGAFAIFIIRNAVNYLGLNSFVSMIITGITLLLGMVINELIAAQDLRKGGVRV